MEKIYERKPGREVMELDCATPDCGYHVHFDPNKKTDTYRAFSIKDGILTVYLECDRPFDSHTNKYRIKESL